MALGAQIEASGENGSVKIPLLNGTEDRNATEVKQNGEESGSTSTIAENVVEKGEVEATKEGEKEKDTKDEKLDKEQDKDKEKDAVNEQEVVYIQDMGFTVKIVSPGAEPFDIQVSSMELVQEIHQLLMDREDTCHRTCFSLQLDGNTLDNFAELKNIEGLKEGSIIKVVEEPYTMREARIHVRHVRDLLKSVDPTDAYNGVECSSLSFLNVVTNGDILEKKKTRADSVDCTPPDYIIPGCKDRPLLPLQPQAKEQKCPPCLKVLTTSGWNPPPGHRKLHGDLLYLHVITLEDKQYYLTACARGFFVNQSTKEVFNPKPATPSHLCHSLIELLNQLSPAFKRGFAAMQRRRTQRHPFERVATPYQLYAWSAPQTEHTIDAIRAEDTFSSKLGYEEHIPGQTRDWNEELQTTRELPRKNLPERLLRERAIFKVHSDFVAAATRGAVAVIDGNVMAINPGEEAKMQMFIWNNIFFSLGFDVRDHYKELGGDAAAFVAPRNDLQGVRVYAAVDLLGLYTLGTVVIDYRGYRVTAQSIIPGILEREQEQSVVYGSIDFGKTVLTHPKYIELLNKAGQQLKILPHKVINDTGEEVELCSSVECKGIIGNDSRHYVLDLLRTFPPDVNFLKLEGVELSKEARALGFPIEHKHKLACLRQELIDSFVEARYVQFIKHAAVHLQQLTSARKSQKEKESSSKENKKEEANAVAIDSNKEVSAQSLIEADEAKKIVESITDSITGGEKQELEESTKEIVRRAAAAVGSLRDAEFDVRFNPDVFSQSNISLILHAVGEYELSLRFLEHALDLNLRYHGPRSLKVAVSYHLVARTQSCMGDFRAALNNEKETYAIYKQQLGEDHEKTKESSDCLRHLTQQAVVLQKKMNEIYTGKSGVTLPPIQVQPPSMGSVLDMLNVINGILFVQISQQDIENFKAEIEKRQKEQSPDNESKAIEATESKKNEKENRKVEQKSEGKKLEETKATLEPVMAES